MFIHSSSVIDIPLLCCETTRSVFYLLFRIDVIQINIFTRQVWYNSFRYSAFCLVKYIRLMFGFSKTISKRDLRLAATRRAPENVKWNSSIVFNLVFLSSLRIRHFFAVIKFSKSEILCSLIIFNFGHLSRYPNTFSRKWFIQR